MLVGDNVKKLKFFGFEFNLKHVLYGLGIYAAFIAVFLIIDAFWFSVSWYGVIIGTGFLLAIIFASELMKERGLPKDFPYDLIWWIFPLSIIGARLYYVLFTPNLNWTFLEILDLRSGGLAIYGGIIGGALGLIICCLIKKQNILKTIDVAAPCLILGQAIGRWGNFVNQEAYGNAITNPSFQWFPIGVYIEREAGWFMATFFYESLWNIVGFFLLVMLLRKTKAVGAVLGGYMAYYGLGRVWIEGLRTDSLYIPGTDLRVSQLVSLVLIFVGIAILVASLVLHKKKTGEMFVISAPKFLRTGKTKAGRIIDNVENENLTQTNTNYENIEQKFKNHASQQNENLEIEEDKENLTDLKEDKVVNNKENDSNKN